MACACKGKKGAKFEIKLPGGLKISRSTLAAAESYVKSHPGATLIKNAA